MRLRVSGMAKEVDALVCGELGQDGADAIPEVWNGSLGGLAQKSFEL